MRIAVITGASSGLGKEFTLQIDRNETDIEEIWLIARRRERLEELAAQLVHPARVFALDLMEEASIAHLESVLKTADVQVGILAVCAGFGKVGNYETVGRQQSDRMIALNCRAAVDTTMIALPYMQAGDRIIEICSTSAFQPFPYLNIYAASKAFLYSYTRALRNELLPRGIKVTAVCPYWIKDTEFIPGADSSDGANGIHSFPLADRTVPVVKRALRASRAGLPVSTPGAVCTLHRIFAKVLPRNILMLIWEGIRRI
ncbi:MAG: SDR family NAD(P)-dependent oxidoreductase [Lachnospiraceae bacterium]|nr:SDR family NAD(P)-dependent oxidoreductase [Lachnospiraceae bacterium]